MPISIANTNLTNTFDYWRTRTNEIADALSTKVLTVDSNNASGNIHINGTVSAVTLFANSISGGNTGASAALAVTSNVVITGTGNAVLTSNSLIFPNSSIIVVNTAVVSTSLRGGNSSVSANLSISSDVLIGNSSSNVYITANSISVNGTSILTTSALINVATTGTSAQLIDSFVFASFRGSEYTIVIRDTNANNVQMTKALVCTDNGDGYITEFGTNISNTDLGIMSANANATHVRVYFTPTVANTLIKGQRLIVVV